MKRKLDDNVSTVEDLKRTPFKRSKPSEWMRLETFFDRANMEATFA